MNGTHRGERTLLSAAFDFPPQQLSQPIPRFRPFLIIYASGRLRKAHAGIPGRNGYERDADLLFAGASAQSKKPKPQAGPPANLLVHSQGFRRQAG
ncbi:MAG: hypothetical protein DMG76_08400 [Acidobacteria bacterium]|nr:MAG: hypothetical protein DMG76_08400 [Acidobacteriota bacterium]